MSAMIPFFSSCSDDDSVNEWDMSYVSLLPADYLQPTPSFTLKHVEEEGIEGSVEFQFMATTQKAIAQDINVRYSVTCAGIQTTHWGAGYAPSKVEIFSSENGDKWTSIGQWDTKGRNQTITFDERIKTRYLKYQMVTVPSRVDITKFYIYAWE